MAASRGCTRLAGTVFSRGDGFRSLSSLPTTAGVRASRAAHCDYAGRGVWGRMSLQAMAHAAACRRRPYSRAVGPDAAASGERACLALAHSRPQRIRVDTLPLVLEVIRDPRYSVSTCYPFNSSMTSGWRAKRRRWRRMPIAGRRSVITSTGSDRLAERPESRPSGRARCEAKADPI